MESSGFTKAAQSALLEAIDDAINRRRGKVRVVQKGASPRPSQGRSHVVNIGAYSYSFDGHIFSWYPSLDSNEKHTLCLCVDGRFLYTHGGRDMRFVAEVALTEVPADQWRDPLQDILKDADAAKWPWGDTLLTRYATARANPRQPGRVKVATSATRP